jgi:hypothetical protein
MADQKGQPKKGGKNVNTSAARKARYAEYKTHKTREKHKIAHILKSSGHDAADKYARPLGMTGFLAGLVKGL